jgi:serine protease AprX
MIRSHRRTEAAQVAAFTGAAIALSLGAVTIGPAQAMAAPIGWSDNAAGTTLDNAMFANNADILRNDGLTGKGVGIALIDTGVAPVAGLTGGNVVNGPDLSFDSQDPAKRYLDGNGHGTHLAGIMVGKASGAFSGGIAPGAKLTSVKVGAANGAVDVSQVIAAVDWVVEHRNDDPANKIRILELSYGTDSVQASQLDPLAFAVEKAWRAGIVVVTAAGNTGGTTPLLNPASNKYVLAVGAVDTMGTSGPSDDRITSFTNRGAATRKVDIVTPGRTILSLRAPGSYIDVTFPTGRVGTQLFKGSGTSQAAAVAAGSIALLFQKRPTLTPDQVKALLIGSAQPVTSTGTLDNGIKAIDVFAASCKTPSTVKQTWPAATGKGTLQGARGTIHVSDDSVKLSGENDVWGPFNSATWAAASANETAWVDGKWMGKDLTGTGWTLSASGRSSWAGRAWSGRAWSGRAWSGQSWSGVAWLGATWS